MFKVFKKPCKNCLLSEDRIVSPERAKEIEESCLKDQTHFVCHKASISGQDTCCSMFFNKHKNNVQKLQIFNRLGMVQKVGQDQTDTNLIAYKNNNKWKIKK